MKKFILASTLLCSLAAAAQAQDQPHKFEVGVDLLNYTPFAQPYDSYYNSRLSTTAQWASGAVVRNNFNRFGLRSGIRYNTGTEKGIDNCNDCLVGESKGKELQVRLGGQYAPVEKAQWLYVFSDFYYRRYTSEGNFTGGLCGCLNTDVTVKSNGLGNNSGLGIKLQIFKRFYLNPEIYYDLLRAHNSTASYDRNQGSSYQGSSRTSLHQPGLRVNALFAF